MNRENLEALYELSPLQQGLLFHSRYAGEAEVYLAQVQCALEGPLDADALERAWKRVLERHPALRTSFHWRDLDKPLQMVERRVELPFARLDWRNLTAAEAGERFESLLREERRRGFDAGRAPLLRLALVQLAEERFRLAWTYHHLILDGWSLPLVLKEVFAFYEAFRRGGDLPLPPARPYRDYTLWLQRQDLARAETFWRETLAGFTAPTPLGADHRATAGEEEGGNFARHFALLPPALTAGLQDLARRHQLTLSTLIQGAWAILLSHYSGQAEVLFGSTSSGRPAELPGVESMIGLFINTLPVRAAAGREDRLIPWLQRLQDLQLRMREFEHSPLVQIQGWSEVPRGLPLFESIVVFESYPLDRASEGEGGGGVRIGEVSALQKTSFPLNLIAVPAGDRLQLRLAYDSRRFDAAAVERMHGHLATLLAGFVEDSGRRLGELPILSAAERELALGAWSGSDGEGPQGLLAHHLFERQAAERPEALALVCGGRSLTYGEMNAEADRLARRLRRLGVGPDVLVGLRMERSIEAMIGLFGILKAGGAYVPLDPGHPADLFRFQLEDTGVRVLLTQAHLRDQVPADAAISVLCLGPDGGIDGPQGENKEPPPAAPDGENLVYVIYTSGSTGRPKGVMVKHRSLVPRVLAMAGMFGLGPGDRQLQIVSLSFDVSCEEVFVTLSTGTAMIIPPPFASMPELLAECERSAITKLNVPAAYLNQMIDEVGAGMRPLPAAITQIVSGAESPSMPKLRLLARRCRDEGRAIRFFNFYGPSETTVLATGEEIPLDPDVLDGIDRVSIGLPLPAARVYLLDPSLRPVPLGVPGEVFIGGVGVARGYLRRPGMTAERFVPNPFGAPGSRLYRSGDLARRLPDGRLEFIGRADHQVKIRGFRVELGEIQATLERHPAVAESVAIVREDAPGDRRLVAYWVPRGAERPSVSELRAFMLERLPEAIVPAAFVPLDALPLNRNGKVDRKALPAPAGLRPDLAAEYAEPATPLERFLAELWREILGLDRVGARDGFFELGGDSLKAARFINKLEKKLGRYVYVTALFDAPDVAAFARHLGETYPEEVGKAFGRESLPESPSESAPRPETRIGAAEIARVRRIIAPLPPFPDRPGSPNPPAAFILSPPRSGSTLLRVMLAGHPRLFAPPELELLSFNTLADRRAAFSGKFALWQEGLLRAVMEVQGCEAGRAREIVEELERRGAPAKELYGRLQELLGDRLLIDKTPSYALDPAVLARAEEDFAGARFIHLIRHPLGMMLSFEEARIDQPFFRHEHDFTVRQLAELVWLVSHQNILAFLARQSPERVHRVHFEDLVRDPEPVLRGLCEFLGVTLHPDMLEPYKGKERRMTDGIHPLAKMVGDVKFHEHSRVDSSVADRWRSAFRGHRLGEETLAMAQAFGYGRPGEEPERSSALVAIQPPRKGQPEQLPLFCVHPAGGTVLCYAELARELGPDQPFYGLQALGLRAGEEPLRSMDEIVDHALAGLDAQGSPGPYRLAGWSFGGYVAYEMARRLAAQGRPVELLALLDTSAALLDRAEPLDDAEILARAFQEILAVPAEELRALPTAEERLTRVIELARAAGAIPPDFDLGQARRYLAVFQANRLAMRGYRPGPYPGRLTLFRAEQGVETLGDETLGWSTLAAEVDVRLVPGRHEQMVRPPHVRRLAEELRACVTAAGACGKARTRTTRTGTD